MDTLIRGAGCQKSKSSSASVAIRNNPVYKRHERDLAAARLAARLDIIDETLASGFDDQPLHREYFVGAIASLGRQPKSNIP
jgi:hypothetical protein